MWPVRLLKHSLGHYTTQVSKYCDVLLCTGVSVSMASLSPLSAATTAAVSNLKMIDKSLDITNSGVGSSSTQDSASVANANNETPDES